MRHLPAAWGEGTARHPRLSFLPPCRPGCPSGLTWSRLPSAWHRSWPGVPLMSAVSASGLFPRPLGPTPAAEKGALEIRVSRVPRCQCHSHRSGPVSVLCQALGSGPQPWRNKFLPWGSLNREVRETRHGQWHVAKCLTSISPVWASGGSGGGRVTSIMEILPP